MKNRTNISILNNLQDGSEDAVKILEYGLSDDNINDIDADFDFYSLFSTKVDGKKDVMGGEELLKYKKALLVKLLVENFLAKCESPDVMVVDLGDLDFSKYDISVSTCGMKVKGNMYQLGHNVEGTIFQCGHNVSGDIYQDNHTAESIYQYSHTVKGVIEQYRHTAKSINQSSHFVKEDILQESHIASSIEQYDHFVEGDIRQHDQAAGGDVHQGGHTTGGDIYQDDHVVHYRR